jgi:DNA-binding response OmpR family regulator
MQNTSLAARYDARSAATARTKSFLVVCEEGDSLLQQLIPDILGSQGFACDRAGSDLEVARLLASGRRILGLIADARVHERRGFEWVQRIRSRLPGLPALLIGGYRNEDAPDPELVGEGRTDVLRIPFSPAQVAERARAFASGSPAPVRAIAAPMRRSAGAAALSRVSSTSARATDAAR